MKTDLLSLRLVIVLGALVFPLVALQGGGVSVSATGPAGVSPTVPTVQWRYTSIRYVYDAFGSLLPLDVRTRFQISGEPGYVRFELEAESVRPYYGTSHRAGSISGDFYVEPGVSYTLNYSATVGGQCNDPPPGDYHCYYTYTATVTNTSPYAESPNVVRLNSLGWPQEGFAEPFAFSSRLSLGWEGTVSPHPTPAPRLWLPVVLKYASGSW